MDGTPTDPKAGEKAYYANLGEAGRRHAGAKPFSDPQCGRYLADLGALLLMLEPAPRAVLDFGCGTGWTSIFLARAGYDVLGVDISADAVAIASDAGREAGLTNLSFVTADYEEFRPDRAFDYVLFYDALHHAESEQAAVAAAFRALKDGGVLFAFEPGAGHSRSPGSRHAMSTYGVHEKDMPPARVWRLGRQAGFRRALFLPMPSENARAIFRRDYLRARGGFSLWWERAWGYFRAVWKTGKVSRSGLILMWK